MAVVSIGSLSTELGLSSRFGLGLHDVYGLGLY